MSLLVTIIVTMFVIMCQSDDRSKGFGCEVCNFGTEIGEYECSKCRIKAGDEPFECKRCGIGRDFEKFDCQQCKRNAKLKPTTATPTSKPTTATPKPSTTTPKPIKGPCDCLDVDGNVVRQGDLVKIDQCNHCECIRGERKYCTNRPDCSLYTCEDGH